MPGDSSWSPPNPAKWASVAGITGNAQGKAVQPTTVLHGASGPALALLNNLGGT